MDFSKSGLSGKIAIVTGASSGIGRATAQLLAQKDVNVALVSRTREALERLSRELPGSRAFPADMTKISDIRRMITDVMHSYGKIDILINNAGRGYDAPVEMIDIEVFRYIYELNVIGPVFAMQQVIPIMRKQGRGTIVNVSSGTALMNLPGMSPYSSSKKALAGISLAARKELEKENIIVSVVYPSITRTEFEKNTIVAAPAQARERETELSGPYPADSAEFVAERIVDGIMSGEAEIYSHEWMAKRR